MNVLNAIYDVLSNDAGVTALCGTRMYPGRAPQGTANPCLTYSVVTNDPTDTKEGPSELDQVRVQVSAFDKEYEDAAALDEAVRTALDRLTAGTYASLEIQSIQYLDTIYLIDDRAGDQGEHQLTSDYKVRLKR